MKILLQHVAHTRSGDKGNTSNIAVIAYEPEFYPLLKEQLTAERFKQFYSGVITGKVTRYEIDGLEALNLYPVVCAWTTMASRCQRRSLDFLLRCLTTLPTNLLVSRN
jgi:hypothetical protein